MTRTHLAVAATAFAVLTLVLWHHRWLTQHRLRDQLLDERAHILHQRARRLDQRQTDLREAERVVAAERTIRRALGEPPGDRP